MNTVQFKEYAKLAQAAYSYFTVAAYRDGDELRKQLKNQDGAKFSDKEAEVFKDSYLLLHQFNEGVLGAGFSASLFRDLDPAHGGQLIFAVRGTEGGMRVER